ncbi:hypothetical protein D3C72_1557700 [compost metagenome]
MQALATTGFQPGFQAQFIQHGVHQPGSLLHRCPLDAFAGIQVEQHAVGFGDSRFHGIPGMEFHHVHLHGRHDGFGRGHFQQRRMIRVQARGQGLHARHGGFQVLLEKKLAVDTGRRAQEGYWAALQMFQHQGCNQAVIARQVQLGQLGRRVDDALWVRQACGFGARRGRRLGLGDCRGPGLGGGRGLRARHRRRLFSCDLAGRLVLAQAAKHRMADMPAAGPFPERHLGHQFRLDPMHAFRLPAADGLLVGFDGG